MINVYNNLRIAHINNIINHHLSSLNMFISAHLFRQFFGPPVSVGTASIPDLTLCRDCTALPMSHDLHFRPRPIDLLTHYQGRSAGFTIKSFKGSSNELGSLGFISQSM